MATTKTPRRSEPEAPRAQVPSSALLVIEQGKNPIDVVSKTLDNRMEQLAGFYNGDTAMAERMKWVALHALSHPKLMEKLMQSDLATVIEALRESAALGLMPIPATAEGYLVPRWNKDKRLYDIQFMPGYRGYVKLMYQSPRVAKIAAGVVYENDEFDFDTGEGLVRHKQSLKDRGQVIATWGKAVILTDGHTEQTVIVYDEAQIAKVRKSSQTPDYGPWVEWPDAMRMKTVLRELRKTVPLSYAAEEAFRVEAEHDEKYLGSAPAGDARQSRLRANVQKRLPGATGDDGVADGATNTGPGAPGAPEGHGEAPAQGREVCGATGPAESVYCDLDPDHNGPHEMDNYAEPWG